MEYNEKISTNDKSPLFVISGFAIMMLHIVTWIVSLIISKIGSRYAPEKLMARIGRVFFVSVPISVFILTCAELNLLIFYQLLYMDAPGQLIGFSVFLVMVSALYYIGMFSFITFALNRNYEDPIERSKVSVLFLFVKED